jgi:hypothetical protein
MTRRARPGLLLTVLLITACVGSPRGQGDGCGDPGAMKKGPCANPAAMVELRLASLKPQLNLTPDQEQSWNAMLDRIRESSKSLEAAGAASRMPTPAEMEGVRVATDRFYASLSPEQRQVMDWNMPRPPPPCLDAGPPPFMIYGAPPAKPCK